VIDLEAARRWLRDKLKHVEITDPQVLAAAVAVIVRKAP
jgi:hypothetical protein